MAVVQWSLLAALLLFVSSAVHCSSPPPTCPESCTCQRPGLLNCSSSDLSYVPQPIQDSITDLDLSHNLLDSVTLHWPHRKLRNVWVGNNTITHLSLCIDRSPGSQSVSGGHLQRFRPWRRGRCVSWAPTLQLLSAERNRMVQFPEGLGSSVSLKVLELSFNKISTIRPGDLSHLQQLRELYLQHNTITTLHPQMFQDLPQLRVLDLSFNMLTNIHPLMYLSLHNIGADVRLDGNRWQCDCNMRSLRKRMAFDSSRGLQVWSMVCAFPSVLSGKDLLQLEEDDLNCFGTDNKPALHQDVTVYSGSEILLSCSAQDSIWWTPSGQVSGSQTLPNLPDLLISDVTERNTGLYVCTSQEHEVVSVFNLQISRVVGVERKTRSLSRNSQQLIPQDNPNKISQERNQGATQSDLALAVCLSIFITFLVAFILGVLARPCFDVLWTKVTKKKRASVSSVQQRPYENEAYSNYEEPEEIITHRERRVTFSTVDTGDGNVQYYDTVASANQEYINYDAVVEYETGAGEANHTAEDPGSDISSQQSSPTRTRVKMEFERIPDPDELKERKNSSSSSNSSLSDIVLKDQIIQGDHTTPKFPQQVEDSIQQRDDIFTSRKVVVPQISIKYKSEIPDFSSEPFADWSPQRTNLTDSNVWQENEEQFDFSDSAQSTSVRSGSVFGSFNDSKLVVVPTAKRKSRDDVSSSSSYVSEDGPTQYTVNSEQEEGENIQRDNKKSLVINTQLKQDSSFDQQNEAPTRPFNEDDNRCGTQRPAEGPKHSLSSHSSDSDDESVWGLGKQESFSKLSSKTVMGTRETSETVKPLPQTKYCAVSVGVASSGKSLDSSTPSPPKTYSTSSSQETEIPHLIVKGKKRRAPLPPKDSSSSVESSDREMLYTKKQNQKREEMHRQWAGQDLEHISSNKRHLDVKVPSVDSSSSSSDSEDQTRNIIKKQEQGKIHMGRLPNKPSPTVSHDSDTTWPSLDLEHIPRIKRRLDIKATSPDSDSSSSSDSEDEATNWTKKQEQGKIHMGRLPNKSSPTVGHDSDTTWPAVDLEHIPRIKRRLDIKATSPVSDSSFSRETVKPLPQTKYCAVSVGVASSGKSLDSSTPSPPKTYSTSSSQETEIPYLIVKGKKRRAPLPPKDSSSSVESSDREMLYMKKQNQKREEMHRQWAGQDLEHISSNKRHLDVKVPSVDSSSSSSDSEDQTRNIIKKQEQGKIHMGRLPNKASPTVSHDSDTTWPSVDLEHIPRIKRRLDIKATSPDSDSSSSSDSEDDTADHTVKQRPVRMVNTQLQKSPKIQHDSNGRWPTVDLKHIPRIKRRLDIKATSPDSDSSSSSDSEDEATNWTKKQEQGKIHMGRLPNKASPTVSHDSETTWPSLDLEHIPRIKRRLDIKATSPDSDSSSSSDSEDDTADHVVKQRPVRMVNTQLQKSSKIQHDSDGRWPAVDLKHIPRIKRRLDIKATSPDSDSSSSSDSEDQTRNIIKKQEQGKIHMGRLPNKASPTVSHDSDTTWPSVDLEHIPRIKRRLDIKATSPDSDSSSSSDSEDDTADHTVKQRPVRMVNTQLQKSSKIQHDSNGRWPAVDLKHIPRIKRRLDIKATSPDSDSSSSSDSEDEATNWTKKQEQGKIHMGRLPNKASPTVSHDSETTWPSLDLEHIPRIKRRLDIKATSPDSDSSSSSDSEDDTADHVVKQRPVRMVNTQLQKSSKIQHDSDGRWPAVDLKHIPRIKRRLDIKATSPDSDSSSSSDSEDEATNWTQKQEQGKIHMGRLQNKASPTVSHDLETQWPLVDLEYTTRIKRRLDIKVQSPDSDSSSSSDSEDDTADHVVKQRPVRMVNTQLQKSPKIQHDSIGRNIKATSPDSDSSSSSDSEDEATNWTKKQEQGKIHMGRLPNKASPTVSHDSDTTWPSLDLEHIPRIKRRLDIKATSPESDSSSSSDSEDDTADHVVKQRPVRMANTQLQKSPKIQHDSIGRNIKATSPDSDSSSSSDSEDQTRNIIKKQEQGKIHMGRLPNKASPTVSHDSDTTWPSLDLEHIPRIKRRLDIKATSPESDSSSSSDSEDDTADHTVKQRPVRMVNTQLQKSPKIRHDSNGRWPTVDLEHIPHIKRRRNIKATSPDSDSSSSSDSEDETTHQRPGEVDIIQIMTHKQGEVQKSETLEPDTRWPQLALSLPNVKRRLDIKTHQPPTEISSSTDESYTGSTDLPQKGKNERTDVRITYQTGTKFDKSGPSVKRHLNIKSPPKPMDSCSSSDSESPCESGEVETGASAMSQASIKELRRFPKTSGINISHNPSTDHNIKLEKFAVISDDLDHKLTNNISTAPENNSELQLRWAKMNLGISRFRKRLEITSRAPVPLNLPPSPPPDSTLSSTNKRETASKRTLLQQSSLSSNTETDVIDHSVSDLSLAVPRYKGHFTERSSEANTSSSSSSDSENEVTGYTVQKSGHASNISGMTNHDSYITYKRTIIKSPLPLQSPAVDKAETASAAQVSLSHNGGNRNVSLTSKVPIMTFDDIVKKRMEQSNTTTDGDLLSDIRRTSVGHQLGFPSSQPDLSAELPDSFKFSRDKSSERLKQDSRAVDLNLIHENASLHDSRFSLKSGRSLEFDNSRARTDEILSALSGDRRERKGLSALQAMSSLRRKWDTEDGDKGVSPPVNDHDPQGDTNRIEENIKPLPKRPQTQLQTSSALEDVRGAATLLSAIPSYKSHNFRDVEPPQEAPPPIPTTQPPR